MRAARALLLLALVPAAASADDLLAEAALRDAAVETRVHALLVHAIDEDRAGLAADVAALEVADAERRDAGQPPMGLCDDARYLAAALAVTRDVRHVELEAILDGHPDDRVRRLAERQLEADDAATADRLLANDRHNRRAQLVNEAIRPLGTFSPAVALAALNPILLAGSVVDSLATTAVNLWNYNRLSAPEREALVRYRTELERAPETVDAPEIATAIRDLGTKRAQALCKEAVETGTRALDDGDLERARYHLTRARDLPDCAARAETPLATLAEARAAHAAAEEAGRWPADEPLRPTLDEADDHDDLLRAAVAGDPGEMNAAAARFLAAHEDSALAPGARYTLAAARDLAGDRAAARDDLAIVADDDDTPLGRHAAAVLVSPEWSRLAALGDAEQAHTRDVVRYVLFGKGWDGRTALYSAAQLGASGMQAAQSLGIVNVIGVLTRAWGAWWHDPASNQAIIERGEELLAREPGSPDAPAVHERLADAYERSGNYERALMHYRATAVPEAGHIARLEGKLADKLLEDAERHGDDPVRLSVIAHYLGDTTAATTAREKLGKRGPDGEITISREVLAATPSLMGPSGLDLAPGLLDGDRSNGELADAGVTLAQGEMRLTLVGQKGKDEQTETRRPPPEVYVRARAAAAETLYTRLVTAEARDPEAGRFERYIPIFVQGSLDETGSVSFFPGIKMRRYDSPDAALYQ